VILLGRIGEVLQKVLVCEVLYAKLNKAAKIPCSSMNPKGATPIGNRFTTLSALHQFCPMLPIIWGDGKKIFRNPKSCPFKTKAKYPVPTTLKH
jgi:hypothetical protein